MRPILLLIPLCAVTCVDNPSPEYKSTYAYSHIEGTLTEYFRGQKRTSVINSDAAYAALFDSSDIFFPQILNRIDQADGRFSVHIAGTKSSGEGTFACQAPVNDSLRCVVHVIPRDTMSATIMDFALHRGKIGVPVFSYRLVDSAHAVQSLSIFRNDKAPLFDSVLASGNFDSLLFFRGEFIYE